MTSINSAQPQTSSGASNTERPRSEENTSTQNTDSPVYSSESESTTSATSTSSSKPSATGSSTDQVSLRPFTSDTSKPGSGVDTSRFPSVQSTGSAKPTTTDSKSASKPVTTANDWSAIMNGRSPSTPTTPGGTNPPAGGQRSARDWQSLIFGSGGAPKDAKGWMDFLKDKGGQFMDILRKGIEGPFKERFGDISGWANNVILNAASNSQHTVGWMTPGGTTAMGGELIKRLKSGQYSSLPQLLNSFAGRSYAGYPPNAKALYWRAKDYMDNPLAFIRDKDRKSTGQFDKVQNVYVGISGGPEGAFAKSINGVSEAMKQWDPTIKRFVSHVGTSNAVNTISNHFARIAEAARKNPNIGYSVAYHLDTHGGTSGGNGKEGSGGGFTQQITDTQLKALVRRHFGGLNNVALNMINSMCHAGAFLG